MADQQTGFFGQQELATDNTDYNKKQFLVKQMLAKLNIATLVQVVQVYPAGTDTPQDVGTVDVLPLVGQVDGSGAFWPATTIFGLPYFRLQAGIAAVVVDPQVGDIGFAIFCDRDISSAKTTLTASGPASARRFDMADGFYLGGWMSKTNPTNFLLISQDELTAVVGAVKMVMNASSITSTVGSTVLLQNAGGFTLTGDTKIVGKLEVTKDVTLDQNLIVTANFTFGGGMTGTGAAGGGNATLTGAFTATGEIKSGTHTLTSHTHTGVTTGGGSTGGPVG